MTRGYKDYKGLKGFKGVTGGWLHEVTRGFKGLQKVLRDYKRLQGVKGG